MKFFRIRFLIYVIMGPVLGMAHASAQSNRTQNASQKPNILIIIADDLGWSDVGYNGGSVRTPTIDQLAKTGLRLDQHYVLPTCTPTRVGLITGKYPSRYGILGPDYGEVIYKGHPTLASLLAANGYATSIVGKWHMGSPPHTPLQYGFQSSYGYLDGQIDPYTHEYKNGRNSWHRNDALFEEKGHATDLITQQAVRTIEQKKNQPFFLYVAYGVPHSPLDEPHEWTSLYDDMNLYPSRQRFAASVSHMDAGIGKILAALDRTGQRNNTIILFMSDNGGQESLNQETDSVEYGGRYADKPHQVLGNNFPLRGWKGDVYEGGIRVPALVNWPGHLTPGASNYPIHVVDWLPTLCSLAQSDNNTKGIKLDGQNVWPGLTTKSPDENNRQMYWKTGKESAVREGDWKLVMHRATQHSELYNLKADFRETTDLSKKHPDKVLHLMEQLKLLEKEDGKRHLSATGK
jgi:arylsulfatase A-like enzyme